MAKNKHEVKAKIDVNPTEQMAMVAAIACAIGFGLASLTFDIFDPLFVAGGAGVIGFAVTHADVKLGVAATVLAVIVFFVAITI